MPQASFVLKALLFLSLLSSCVQKEETLENKADKIDALDKEWSKMTLRKEMCIDLIGGSKSKYDTFYVYDYFDGSNKRRYRILCSTDQSMVKIFLENGDDALKMTRYYAGMDSFVMVHFTEPRWLERHIGTQLNPDTVPFFSYEEKTLFKRILNIKND